MLLGKKKISVIYSRQCQSQVSSQAEKERKSAKQMKAREQCSDLIQIGTCQKHTTCSWTQPPDPPQSDTCQAHTICSRPPWSHLSHVKVGSARTRLRKDENDTNKRHAAAKICIICSLLHSRFPSASVSLILSPTLGEPIILLHDPRSLF